MSKASLYADLSGIDQRIIDVLLPSFAELEDGAIVDQLLNLAPSLEGVDVLLVVETITSLTHRCKKEAVVGALLDCFQQVPKSQGQPRAQAAVSCSTPPRDVRSASPNDHDYVETVSPQQQQRGGGGILSWFRYGKAQVDSTARLKPVVISETPEATSRNHGEECGWRFDDESPSPGGERRYNDLPCARDFDDEEQDEDDQKFDELLQQFVDKARNES